MRVALDAMGGDYAPGPNIDGAIAALAADPGLEVLLVGDQPRLGVLVEESGYSGERLRVVPAEGFIGMDEKPTQAMRQKPRSSISVCWELMAGREADAVVSAGNTGAVVAAGLRTRLFLKGVKRPGIAVTLPTIRGRAVLVDVGANPAARPEHLYQYGVMGSIYAQAVLGVEQPRVGLMNIGTEDTKGNDLYRETHQLLASSGLKGRYVGNVEGRGLYQGEADVLICEGFVGNVVLKVSEGMAEFMLKAVAREILGRLQAEQDAARQSLEALAHRYRYSSVGGAPLLGIDGICIICHGSSDSVAVANALKVAATFQDQDVNSRIVAELTGEAAS
ncbi:MAG TPA: phosphate acyltransferase PlsX [Planctomycetaceae bacterium]|nr:phosphate acyltransferase PlsX [Planctomycetaceae bacterium]